MIKKNFIFVFAPTARNANKSYVDTMVKLLAANYNIILIAPSYFSTSNLSKYIFKTIRFSANTKLGMFFNFINIFFFTKLFYNFLNINSNKLVILNGDSYPFTIALSIFSKLFKYKVYVVIHDVVQHPGAIIDSINKLLRFISFIFYDFFIVHSLFSEKLFKKKYPKCNVSKIDHPSTVFSFDGFSLVKNNNNYSSDFIFFGRADSYKGLDFLAEVLLMADKKINNKIIFYLVGKGSSYDKLLNIQNKLSFIKIIIINKFVSDHELLLYIANSKCLILPYTQASQSGVPLIAHYYGLRLILSNVGGLPEFLPEEDLIKFESNDAYTLTNIICNYSFLTNSKKIRKQWHVKYNKKIINRIKRIIDHTY